MPAQHPMLWNGIQIFEHPLALKRVERRVKGGYLNRWLIREIAMVPCVMFVGHALFVHPALMPSLRKQIEASTIDRSMKGYL